MLSGLGMQYWYLNLLCVTTNITFTSTHTSFKVQNGTAAWGGLLVRCMNTLDSIANFKVRALFSRGLVKHALDTPLEYIEYAGLDAVTFQTDRAVACSNLLPYVRPPWSIKLPHVVLHSRWCNCERALARFYNLLELAIGLNKLFFLIEISRSW